MATTNNESHSIACDLSALDDPESHEQVSTRLLRAHTGIEELEDGYALKFPGFQWAEPILEFIAGERQCCPFYTFELAVEPDDRPVWLRFRGNEEVKTYTTGWINQLKEEYWGNVDSFATEWKENHS